MGNYNKRFLKSDFKNNMYLRKLVRLKYSRLKNKELYSIFKNIKDYKELIDKLSCRLDICLYNVLKVLDRNTVFSIRQLISHGFFSLNGRKVKSCNIQLKPFDIISFNLSDQNLIINEMDHIKKENLNKAISHILEHCSNISRLTEDERNNLLKDISKHLSECYGYAGGENDINALFNSILNDKISSKQESNSLEKN